MVEFVELVLEDLTCSPIGLTALGGYASAVQRNYGKKIIVDCSLVRWIDGNMAAALSAIGLAAALNDTLIEFRNLDGRVRNVLERIGLFPGRRPPHKSCIPLKHFGLGEGKTFASYTSQEFARQEMPIMSAALRQKFFEGLDELFNNATIHSLSTVGIFASGQAYPQKSVLDFSISDLGIGFKANVEKFLKQEIGACQAIAWAMEENTTTRSGDIPGGLGLAILKEFVELNRGRLTIFSDYGYWNLSAAGIKMLDLKSRFPGAFINLEVDFSDPNIYVLDGEVDPNLIL